MTSENRNMLIENFIEKWDEAMVAAKEITDFTWQFGVTITSDTAIIDDRVKTINKINESFTKNRMSWSSTSK